MNSHLAFISSDVQPSRLAPSQPPAATVTNCHAGGSCWSGSLTSLHRPGFLPGSQAPSVAAAAAAVAALAALRRNGRRQPGRVRGKSRVVVASSKDVEQEAAPDSDELLLSEMGEWCALYINLTRRADRKDRLEKLLATENGPLLQRLERVEAIDREDLTLDDEVVLGAVQEHSLERARRALEEEHYTIVHDGTGNLVHFDDHLTLGGIACALSHRKALERIATHPTAEWGLVLEDDVNALVPRADLAIARMMRQLPEDWDAVCLAYHDPRGRVHPSANAGSPAERVDVEVLRSTGHVFGLGAWMVRKAAAKELVENAFPIGSQVDFTLTNWLACYRKRLWKVDPTNLLFYAPSSEEEMDSDVQTMVPISKIEETHESLQKYIDHMKGRSADDYDYSDFFDEEEWMREWQESRYEEYGGGSNEPESENWNPDEEDQVDVSESDNAAFYGV